MSRPQTGCSLAGKDQIAAADGIWGAEACVSCWKMKVVAVKVVYWPFSQSRVEEWKKNSRQGQGADLAGVSWTAAAWRALAWGIGGKKETRVFGGAYLWVWVVPRTDTGLARLDLHIQTRHQH
ncbi:MAG TPA: hypothetical protein VK638_54270 [Edaphobacter sp.]|nr:hypothetical protein [Edaphobacter sp.]